MRSIDMPAASCYTVPSFEQSSSLIVVGLSFDMKQTDPVTLQSSTIHHIREVVMKAIIVAVAVLIAASATRAQYNGDQVLRFKNATIEQTEKSLIQALESNSPGLQVSAAITVRELKTLFPDRSFSSLVIPLMRIVKDEDGEGCSRVVAALALHDLHSAIGDYAISRAAQFAECSQLKRACAWLSYYRYAENHPDMATKGSEKSKDLTYGFEK